MIFKIFSPKNSAEKLSFFTQIKAELCKILIITLVFEKNASFFAENCRKSQKIEIITLTPDWANFRPMIDHLLWAVTCQFQKLSTFWATLFNG
jgi:hypothetical protein